MKSIRILPILAAFVVATATAGAEPPTPSRVVFLVPVPNATSENDGLFLATVPAAAVAGNGEPVVCSVEPGEPWRPELLDYLTRYKPGRIVWVGPAPAVKPPDNLKIEVMAADTAAKASCKLAASFWGKSTGGVVYNTGDRAAALSASVLAARMSVPLFPWSSGPLPVNTHKCLTDLGVKKLLVVGAPQFKPPAGISAQHLKDSLAVASSLAKWRNGVDYLALVHPRDGGVEGAPRLSLSAVLLAAGRGGVVVPLPFDTIWKRKFQGEVTKTTPEGTHPSKEDYRTGKVTLGATPVTFVTGLAKGRWWVQLDLNGDGRFTGEAENPLNTGNEVTVDGTRYTVNVDVLEKERGSALWLTSPTPPEIVDLLGKYRKAIDSNPRYLCIVGWPDAVPLANISDCRQSSELVSDHPYAQTDDDPFVDMAFARFIGEDAASGTLLACRSLTYDDLSPRPWEGTYVTAHWAKSFGCPPQLAGMRHIGHHDKKNPIGRNTPFSQAGIILHGEHSAWGNLGKTYTWKSTVPLSPCLVESSGCSTAAIDKHPERRSVAARMLRNGAVAFCSNARRGVGQQGLYVSELWNALLAGQSLGEAHRHALNRNLIVMLEKGQQNRGGYYYQYNHRTVYGDPALNFGFKKPPANAVARVQVNGVLATVQAPREFVRKEYDPNPEWKCEFPKLWCWTGLGVGRDQQWHHEKKYDHHDLLFTAEVRSRRPFINVEPTREVRKPLGWTGKSYVDKHADGTQSLYWRCRMIDFDQTTGKVHKQVPSLGFRLLTE